jgi:leader peptidase (prepilin peptidase)/N-methyltransferase
VSLRVLAVVVWIVLAVLCAAVFGWSLDALVGAAGCAVLVAVTVTDIERRIIPNRIVLPALAAALVVQTLREPGLEWLLAALAAGGFFLVLALVNPVGLGMGDVKLAAFLGAWLGRDVLFALVVGSLLGAAIGLLVLGRRGSEGRRATLPYGPALAAGGIAGLFLGDAVMDAWLG